MHWGVTESNYKINHGEVWGEEAWAISIIRRSGFLETVFTLATTVGDRKGGRSGCLNKESTSYGVGEKESRAGIALRAYG